jgi:hypothetical protein
VLTIYYKQSVRGIWLAWGAASLSANVVLFYVLVQTVDWREQGKLIKSRLLRECLYDDKTRVWLKKIIFLFEIVLKIIIYTNYFLKEIYIKL